MEKSIYWFLDDKVHTLRELLEDMSPDEKITINCYFDNSRYFTGTVGNCPTRFLDRPVEKETAVSFGTVFHITIFGN